MAKKRDRAAMNPNRAMAGARMRPGPQMGHLQPDQQQLWQRQQQQLQGQVIIPAVCFKLPVTPAALQAANGKHTSAAAVRRSIHSVASKFTMSLTARLYRRLSRPRCMQ